ncbi:MAG: CHASE3 domain-containing protein [Myxococcales bacterium]|nr:CHASE3 domain-containing protein [Myxococcales bacterium]
MNPVGKRRRARDGLDLAGDANRSADLARRMARALLVPLALLFGLGIILTLQIYRMTDDARWVDHSDQVIGKTQALRLGLVDQESAVRGFLLTGDAKYREDSLASAPST